MQFDVAAKVSHRRPSLVSRFVAFLLDRPAGFPVPAELARMQPEILIDLGVNPNAVSRKIQVPMWIPDEAHPV